MVWLFYINFVNETRETGLIVERKTIQAASEAINFRGLVHETTWLDRGGFGLLLPAGKKLFAPLSAEEKRHTGVSSV
jgi:hypothetical protein